MSSQQTTSIERILVKLDERARAARTISIAITFGAIAIGALLLFFTYKGVEGQIRRLSNQVSAEQEKLRDLTNDQVVAMKQLDTLREEEARLQERIRVLREVASHIPAEERQKLTENAEKKVTGNNLDSPKIYIQILDNTQREQAKRISETLRKNNLNVQGIEWVRVPVSKLNETQIRYFRPELKDRAKVIADLLKRSGIQNATPIPVKLNSVANQIEVWFSPDAFANTP